MQRKQLKQLASEQSDLENGLRGRCLVRCLQAVHAHRRRPVLARVLTAITEVRGLPGPLNSDNGSEFISRVMEKWAYERGFELDHSRQGKPTDNANVESLNGRLRQECLNATWFMSLDGAWGKIGMSTVPQREPCALHARPGHPRRIFPPLLAAGSNGDRKGAGNLYFRAGLDRAQVH